MSHIPGHVINPPRSFGKLRSIKSTGDSEFVRIPEEYKGKVTEGQRVGFHPRKDDKGEVWATDLADWDAHIQAEKAVLSSLKLGVSSFEELHGKTQLQDEIRKALQNGEFEKHKDVITRTLDYLNTPDFQSFYVKDDKKTIRKADEIIEKVNEVNTYKGAN